MTTQQLLALQQSNEDDDQTDVDIQAEVDSTQSHSHLIARYIRKASTYVLKQQMPQSNGSGGAAGLERLANLTSSIGSSMRSNVTRAIYMYAQNSSDMLDSTTTTTTTTTTTMMGTGTGTALAAPTTRSPLRFINRVAHVTNAALAAAKTATATATTTPLAAAAAAATATATATANLPAKWNETAAMMVASTATSYENCSALFANYTQPTQSGLYCNWTWDTVLCWPPTPAGVLARLNCPAGVLGVDTHKFALRKCKLDGHWGGRPNETADPNQSGWTDYGPCFKPEVIQLMQQIPDMDRFMDIAKRTRTLEIVGLCLSLLALIISLIIFCTFRSLRNNRTKIHKNLFIAMVLQVNVRLTLYLDQATRRGGQETPTNTSRPGIENIPYLCEASYVLLEHARTAMFMWMFIEGLYLHNMVTVAVFQGNFPYKLFSLIGWGVPVIMTTVWALCSAIYMDTTVGECLWNYNLTPYYWILEGPRLIVILVNFGFLVNIIRVLVVKLRQSQASDIEQTRKAVRAAIVLLPLLGITNLLHLLPDLKTAWKFAVWSYVTHFLTSFQGFFIALIYCFLNGEVRAVLLKSLAVYMSVRGHPEWVPKRASMYSGAYNTAPDTDALQQPGETLPSGKRVSPPNRRLNCRRGSSASIVVTHKSKPRTDHPAQRQRFIQRNNNNANALQQQQLQQQQQQLETERAAGSVGSEYAQRIRSKESPPATATAGSNWMINLCFRGQKDKCVMPGAQMPQQIFMTSQMPSPMPPPPPLSSALTSTTTTKTIKARTKRKRNTTTIVAAATTTTTAAATAAAAIINA